MLACFPSGKPNDGQRYMAAVVAVLAEYPPEVVRKVTNPVHGIARRVSFLPTIKEITDACEAEMLPLRKQWREEKERAERRHEPAEYSEKVARGLESLVADLSKGMAP